MERTVVCYKLKKPIVYNKGTDYEKSEDKFLAFYSYKTEEEAQEEVDIINKKKPERLWNGEKLDWNNIDYFFVSKQEEMY